MKPQLYNLPVKPRLSDFSKRAPVAVLSVSIQSSSIKIRWGFETWGLESPWSHLGSQQSSQCRQQSVLQNTVSAFKSQYFISLTILSFFIWFRGCRVYTMKIQTSEYQFSIWWNKFVSYTKWLLDMASSYQRLITLHTRSMCLWIVYLNSFVFMLIKCIP